MPDQFVLKHEHDGFAPAYLGSLREGNPLIHANAKGAAKYATPADALLASLEMGESAREGLTLWRVSFDGSEVKDEVGYVPDLLVNRETRRQPAQIDRERDDEIRRAMG